MRAFSLSTLRWLALLLFFLLFGVILLRWISLERLRLTQQRLGQSSFATPTARPLPTPTPWRTPIVTGRLDTAKLWSGITIHGQVDPTPGRFATIERDDPQSYLLDLKLRVRVPAPNESISDLEKVAPDLPKLLPKLATLLGPGAVSPLFRELYELKVQSLREHLARLDQLLSRHNFYDCQTILRLTDPQTKRRVVLLQADMDVDADGSDADRVPISAGGSLNFKPFTSYRWKKRTAQPNAFLAPTEEKLRAYEAEFALRGLTIERNRDLRLGIQRLRDEVDSLKRFSFLIAATDPYIVLPGIFLHEKDSGQVGDYAVVAIGDQLYPAIVGDVGPADRVGEASLRIAQQVNALATANNRPVSDLKVTYLIFPNTADKPFGPPDLDKMEVRCKMLLQEIGGASVPLHHWENLIPPSPPPTPTITPTPAKATTASPTATTTASPSETLSPNESPVASPNESTTPSPAPTFAFPTPSAIPSPTISPVAKKGG